MSRTVHSRGAGSEQHSDTTQRQPRELAPALALGAWAASLVEGRRVAVVGDTSTGIAEQLAEAARRRVHAYDTDRARAAASIARARSRSGEVSFAPLDEAMDARQGAFDAIVVPDLAELGDDAESLGEVETLLSARGVLVVASANTAHPLSAGRSGLGYYELYDLLSDRFEQLQMFGQAPFTGYTVADFAAEGDPAITVDGSLMPGTEEPLWFIAVASNDPVRVEPYTLLQLPLASCQTQLGLRAETSAETSAETNANTIDTAALAEAKLKSSAMAAELDKLRERERDLNRLAEERKQNATALSVQVTELRSQVAEAQRELDRKQREMAKQSDVLLARTRDIAKLRIELDGVERELKRVLAHHDQEREAAEEAYQEELDRMLERIAELEGAEDEDVETPTERAPSDAAADAPTTAAPEAADARSIRGFEFQIEELKKALVDARNDLIVARADAKKAEALAARVQELEQRGPVEAAGDAQSEQRHAAEIDALESRLKERAKTIDALTRELREGERVGRELLRELESARAASREATVTVRDPAADGAAAELAARHHVLEQKCIRYEADLQAANWTIASLNNQLANPLASQEAAGGDVADDRAALEEALREAREQLARLRTQAPNEAGSSDD